MQLAKTQLDEVINKNAIQVSFIYDYFKVRACNLIESYRGSVGWDINAISLKSWKWKWKWTVGPVVSSKSKITGLSVFNNSNNFFKSLIRLNSEHITKCSVFDSTSSAYNTNMLIWSRQWKDIDFCLWSSVMFNVSFKISFNSSFFNKMIATGPTVHFHNLRLGPFRSH